MKLNNPKLNPYVVVKICIIVGWFFFFPAEIAAAQWSAYFSADLPMTLPICAQDTEIPQWELFAASDGQLYALNFKNSHLVIFDKTGNIKNQIKLPLPKSILKDNGSMWVEADRIYLKPVADKFVWIFNLNGTLLKTVKLEYRTDSYNDFLDIAVDPRGYIYILDGRTEEIKIFFQDGKYQGVFLKKGGRSHNLPGTPECFHLDNEGNFYFSVRIPDTVQSRILKYSYQGRLIASFEEKNANHRYRAIWVDSFQNLYAIAPEESLVVKFDPRGQKICQFNTDCLMGLTVNQGGIIFLASPNGNTIHTYLPSRVVSLIDLGNQALADNMPDQAEQYFNQALVLNNQLDYLHSILGEVYFHQHRFKSAMIKFRYIRDYWRFSQSLSRFRHELITDYSFWFYSCLALIILFCFIWMIYSLNRNEYGIAVWNQELLKSKFAFLKSIYLLSPVKSIILILVMIISYYYSWYLTNPIFTTERQVLSIQIFARYLLLIMLLMWIWSLVAYKVGELFQGLAQYPVILGGAAVSVIPLVFSFPILALISNFLTYDELWIFQWLKRMMFLYVAGLMLKNFKVVEGFSWGKAFGLGCVNLAVSGLVLIFIGFLSGINYHLINFITDLVNELLTRFLN